MQSTVGYGAGYLASRNVSVELFEEFTPKLPPDEVTLAAGEKQQGPRRIEHTNQVKRRWEI